MCNCKQTVAEKLNEGQPDGFRVSLPVELLSGRIYLSCIQRGVTSKGKSMEKTMPLLLSKCPFCGEVYSGVKEAQP